MRGKHGLRHQLLFHTLFLSNGSFKGMRYLHTLLRVRDLRTPPLTKRIGAEAPSGSIVLGGVAFRGF
jgi:hypothetical protein